MPLFRLSIIFSSDTVPLSFVSESEALETSAVPEEPEASGSELPLLVSPPFEQPTVINRAAAHKIAANLLVIFIVKTSVLFLVSKDTFKFIIPINNTKSTADICFVHLLIIISTFSFDITA